MIKVNLLDSVTERASSVAVVEQKVANPAARFWMLGGAVFLLLGMGMLFDYVSAAASQARAREELDKQQQIAAQMAAVNKEQAELEKKLKDINARIEAIKKLRASQQGPVALLSDVNARIPSDPDFRLESVEQKDGELTIIGMSSNEYMVTAFGRSLEFSDGLFKDVSIKAERREVALDRSAAAGPEAEQFDFTYKPQIFAFEIKCKYGPAQQQPAPPQQPAKGGPVPPPGPAAKEVAQK